MLCLCGMLVDLGFVVYYLAEIKLACYNSFGDENETNFV